MDKLDERVLGDASLDDFACGLGLEDTWLLGEGVDSLAGRLGGHRLDGELGEAGEDEHATLLHLEGANGLESGHGEASFLALETGEVDHVVQQLTLFHFVTRKKLKTDRMQHKR